MITYRYLYLPLSALVLFFTFSIMSCEDYLIKKGKIISHRGLLVSLFIVVFICLLIPQGRYYKNNYSYSKAIAKQWPNSRIARHMFADASWRRGDLDVALSQYSYLENLGERNSYLYFKIGFVHMLKGDLFEAKEKFKQAIDLNPGNFFALYNYGKISLDEGDNLAAIVLFKKAKGLAARDILTAVNLGEAYYRAGKFSSARQEWLYALSLDPNNELVKSNLSKLDK